MPEKKNLEVINDNKSYIENEDKLSIKQRQNDTPKETLRKHASRPTEELTNHSTGKPTFRPKRHTGG